MLLKTQAATEIARFLANHPTPEQIVAFHPSSEVADSTVLLSKALPQVVALPSLFFISMMLNGWPTDLG